ncbi:MAG: hypothetical protein LBJ83_00030 [Oscillospiraceae bacterium]|jgi:hypothetical protein|nr:hypothetical protein [Oscillospiraceae bacterium]
MFKVRDQMKKHLKLLFLIACSVFLHGCTEINLDIKGAIHAPLLSNEQKGLKAALKEHTNGRPIKLIYPHKGEYMTPFFRQKTDGKNNMFFVLYSDKENRRAVAKIGMLKKTNDSWKVISDETIFESYNIEIEKVAFLKMSENENKLLVINGSATNKQAKKIALFKYDQTHMENVTTEDCTDAVAYDIDKDGLWELICVDRQSADVQVLKFDTNSKNKLKRYSTVLKQDKKLIGHHKITIGPLKNGNFAIFVDEVVYSEKFKSEMLLTEILEFSKRKIYNQTYKVWDYQNETDYDITELTQRDVGIELRDVDNDGCLEIPREVYIADQVEGKDLKQINWLTFSENALETKKVTLVNSLTPYTLELPEKWIKFQTKHLNGNKFTLKEASIGVKYEFKVEENKNRLTIYDHVTDEEYLCIYAISKNENTKNEFVMFESDKDYVYYVRVAKDNPDIDVEKLKKYLKIGKQISESSSDLLLNQI